MECKREGHMFYQNLKYTLKTNGMGQLLNTPHMFNAKAIKYKKIPGVTLESLKVVKVLGVHIDFKLKFDEHVSVLCSKSSRQINVLARLRH